MKNTLFLLAILFSLPVMAQKIGGFYSGTLFNDSTKMVQKYELALDDYRGKITGYSYVTFVSNDTFYYGIRRVKGEIVGDSLIVQDDKMIANNFPVAPAKGVGRVITIPLKGQDSLVVLNGTWKTNRTKKYYSVPGAIDLSRSQDSAHSPLIGHLKELNLIASNNTAVVNNSPVTISPNPSPTETPVLVKASPEPPSKPVKEKVKTKTEKIKVKTEKPQEQAVVKTEPVTPALIPVPPAATAPVKLSYDQRKNIPLSPVDVVSDSLILSFYDNGVVDGDSISVYLNGNPVVQGARLTTNATKRTVSVANMAEVELILVAENLGRLPPNTGLLTIRDGDNVYQINFSADLQNNASILLRRKKKP